MCALVTGVQTCSLPISGVRLFDILTDAAITLLFFLQGAKLSRQALLSGAGAWKLHGAVLTSTFLIFPLLGLGIGRLHLLDPTMAAGFLFLPLLPSTVQSSIAFTSIARGNIAAAVCRASFSNLIGARARVGEGNSGAGRVYIGARACIIK